MDLEKEIERRGLKKKYIARKAGISQSYLSKILNKERNLKRNPGLREKIINAVKGVI